MYQRNPFQATRRRRRRRPARTATFLTVLALCAFSSSGVVAEEAAVEGASETRPIAITYDGGLMAFSVEQVPLEDLLRAIAQAAGFDLVLKAALPMPVTWSVEGMAPDRLVATLLGRGSSMALYGPAPDGQGSVLTEVHVLRAPPASPAEPSAEVADTLRPASGGDWTADLDLDRRVVASLARDRTGIEASLGAHFVPPVETERKVARRVVPAVSRQMARQLQDSDNPRQRRRAAVALGQARTSDAVPPLVQALEDDDPGVRQRAAQGLGRHGGSLAVAPLSRALLEDTEPRVRRMAASSLGRITDERAWLALLEAQSDSDASVRDAARNALAGLERRGIGARGD